MRGREGVGFLREFFRAPMSTGAIAPSSRRLAEEMVKGIEFDVPLRVAEYGPGTGRFTEAILDRLAKGSKFFAVERNEQFGRMFAARFPSVSLHLGSAERIKELCEREGVSHLDCIICGLPWASFPEGLQKDIMEATLQVLRPGGHFRTFAYLQGLLLPGGVRFRRLLKMQFSVVDDSSIVWGNIPPAFVYQCRR